MCGGSWSPTGFISTETTTRMASRLQRQTPSVSQSNNFIVGPKYKIARIRIQDVVVVRRAAHLEVQLFQSMGNRALAAHDSGADRRVRIRGSVNRARPV
ncbi:unnamed protein product [Linum trigynum]|uniref:Uncharacterized protein n=1 Tax=Linum trigynum TaxID=586398 RepID=A0AAV2DUW9_9ROSI